MVQQHDVAFSQVPCCAMQLGVIGSVMQCWCSAVQCSEAWVAGRMHLLVAITESSVGMCWCACCVHGKKLFGPVPVIGEHLCSGFIYVPFVMQVAWSVAVAGSLQMVLRLLRHSCIKAVAGLDGYGSCQA